MSRVLPVPVDELAALLPVHIGRQRWFGGDADDVVVDDAEIIKRPWPGVLRVVFRSQSGRYQTFIGLREMGTNVDAPLGVLRLPEGDAVCVDATLDPELGLLLLEHVTPGTGVTSARPMGVEQSNTSIVYDERLILKLFRRLVGTNPEVEVTTGLAAAGFDHVAAPIAVWQEAGDDLALVQPFLAGSIEGWALALTSLRSLLDEGVEPDASGADFAPEAARLGQVTADMHGAFRAAFGASSPDTEAWAAALGDAAPQGAIDEYRSAIAAVAERIRTLSDAGAAVRVHGDYHLGQVLRTDHGWYVLDFEGEPARPVADRRRPSSPLRDVAGMLRSFSYAAAVAVRERDEPTAGELAGRWEARNREAFTAAYLDAAAGTGLLPSSPDATTALMAAFELDKALYEVAYELAHRPDWVESLSTAVRRIVDSL